MPAEPVPAEPVPAEPVPAEPVPAPPLPALPVVLELEPHPEYVPAKINTKKGVTMRMAEARRMVSS